MKLALAAEGEWELGSLPDLAKDDSVGRILVERIIASTYPAPGIRWMEPLKYSGKLVRSHRSGRGEEYTAALVYRLAVRGDCDGLVLLRDNDRKNRRSANAQGLREAASRVARPLPAVLGLQVETLEAWLLADPAAFANVLGRRRPPLPSPPEELWGKVGDQRSNHPKVVMERLVRELGGTCDRHLAARLAEHADLDVVAAACPLGFGQFKRDLERAFRPFDSVIAADQAGGIGRGGDLPWPRLKGDLRFLREQTSAAPAGTQNAVIMGRKTWDSIPLKFRPLPNRLNVVISRQQLDLGPGALLAHSFDDALTQASMRADVEGLFVIGGAEIYRQAFAHPRCRDVYLTRIDATFDCDAFIPDLGTTFAPVEDLATHDDSGFTYRIERWRRQTRLPARAPDAP